ncbi:hypothetical protein NFI96_028902, partial [Prochilodus magdalenae]
MQNQGIRQAQRRTSNVNEERPSRARHPLRCERIARQGDKCNAEPTVSIALGGSGLRARTASWRRETVQTLNYPGVPKDYELFTMKEDRDSTAGVSGDRRGEGRVRDAVAMGAAVTVMYDRVKPLII